VHNLSKFTYLRSVNAEYIDELFARYLEDPYSIDPSWQYFFDGLELGNDIGSDGVAVEAPAPAAAGLDLSSEAKVADLINSYRELGRLLANLNPLGAAPSSHPLLELSRFGLSSADLGKTFTAGKLIGMGQATLADIIARLKDTYCGTIGVEFTHIQDRKERDWLQSRMESSRNRETLDAETRKFVLKRLTESEGFERFLHTRYVAKKRFSVEGGESVIPALDCMIEIGAELGVKEVVVGMAHRGRLNVLTHIFGKKLEYIFTEFEETYHVDLSIGEGDVKYHMGYSSDFTTRKGKQVHLSLASNPSHLEFVNPVVEGMARAKQEQLGDTERAQVMPILIHGDAAFAGQGVCYETLNLSLLPGYATGGTLHIVINNQVGFTTSPKDSRSTTYSTDLAKMLECPIFHINGDDPEAVWYVSKLATEYRQKFKKDFFIDLVCYRKHGHNEGDEPSYTQPLMYKQIKVHPSTRELYGKKLATVGVLSADGVQGLVDEMTQKCMTAQAIARKDAPHPPVSVFEKRWKGFRRASEEDLFKTVKTSVDEKTLKDLASKINQFPAGFHLHPKLAPLFQERMKSVQEGKNINWGTGEGLAYATLLLEGHQVRISGQDAERGTFTHRHAVLNDVETGQSYCPYNQLGKYKLDIHNSHLSETGVMGFEYGYSLTEPNALVCWEAQFGDFANGAQVIIDQFIAASESKWQRMSGLVLLLPHGYEGQGPEHSSARLERFLQLCGRNNMAVCNFTTPAQLFHALRRQMKRDFRKPMVLMTPKSLLRHPKAVSDLTEFTQGSFQEILDDSEIRTDAAAAEVRKVLLCSGKVYFDLLSEKVAQKRTDVAVVRMEQFYPWPAEKLASILNRYSKANRLVWVQEEPRNMGGWSFVYNQWSGGFGNFQEKIGNRPLEYVGRELAAAPAVGSPKVHDQEQKALVEKAFS